MSQATAVKPAAAARVKKARKAALVKAVIMAFYTSRHGSSDFWFSLFIPLWLLFT